MVYSVTDRSISTRWAPPDGFGRLPLHRLVVGLFFANKVGLGYVVTGVIWANGLLSGLEGLSTHNAKKSVILCVLSESSPQSYTGR